MVGDIAITMNWTRMVDFTQSYIESGLVAVAPEKQHRYMGFLAAVYPDDVAGHCIVVH